MKLSEAILEGCKSGPQLHYQYLHPYNTKDGTHYESCALGAAYLGFGGTVAIDTDTYGAPIGFKERESTILAFIEDHLDPYDNQYWNCPYVYESDDGEKFSCEEAFFNPMDYIIHLNDEHNYTREEIATLLQEEGL